MRIAMLIPSTVPVASHRSYCDAPEVQARRLARSLSCGGHHVGIYTRRCRPDNVGTVVAGPRLTIEHLSAGPPVLMDALNVGPHLSAFAESLVRAWRGCPPDLVHAHSWPYGLTALLAARGDRRLPVVQTFHALAPGSPDTARGAGCARSNEQARITRIIATRSDGVTASCATEADHLVHLGVARSRISLVPYGALAEVDPHGPDRADPPRLRLTVLDQLGEQHGVDDIVTALRGVPEAELTIAGGPRCSGLSGDPDVHRILSLAQRTGVADRVSLLGGMPLEQVPAVLRATDVVVSVPRSATTGQVALDAMACGVPVVCSGIGGLGDAVVDGITGVCVPPGRPDHLARALRELGRVPHRRAAFGIAGRDRLVAGYEWGRITRETVRLYECVLGPSASALQDADLISP
jgi:D-inositol-3-phosphate glycosyltransferase